MCIISKCSGVATDKAVVGDTIAIPIVYSCDESGESGKAPNGMAVKTYDSTESAG